MNLMLISLITLVLVSAFSAVILYFVSRKFHVHEDARIAEVEALLPAANCGGCGFPGCRGFASACVNAGTLAGLVCPVGGNPTMQKVASTLGKTAVTTEPTVAVVRCNGNCDVRPRTNRYDGASSCAIAHNLYSGETACSWGCLGLGDCELSCKFDAIHINPDTLLPEVVEEKCTSCGACVRACPKIIIELRKKGPKSRRIYVGCVNKDKGVSGRKACSVACTGCSECMDACEYGAITLDKNLAYIDAGKCKICRKCVAVCPSAAITEINFPPRKAEVRSGNPVLEVVS
ncbi:MAG TPA: Fe-S cluster domain-containing protein [Paludibacter sp.]|nr:Fe-S cluster domain-containing protein [Paludibacter sp.]